MQIYWNPHRIRTCYPFLTEVEDQEALRRGHCYRPLRLFTYKSSRSTDKISDLQHSLTCVRNLRPAQQFFPRQFNLQNIQRFTNRSDTTYCKRICRCIVKTKFISRQIFFQMNSPWTPHRPSAWCPQVVWSKRSSAYSAATPGTPPPPTASAGRSSRWIASSWRRRSRWECGWFHPACPAPRSAGAAIAWRLSLLQPTISKSPPPRI